MTHSASDTRHTPHQYGKLGILHCGVTHQGFIAVAGDPRDIADGEEIVFERVGVKARRDGSQYTFSRVQTARSRQAA